MAPIKFEDKLKDKLENRTLQPSADAWNTLADRLDKEDNNNNNTRFWLLGIAASVLGVILVTTQFYKTTEVTKDLPIIVDTNSNTQKDSKLIKEPITTNDYLTTSEKKENIEIINTTEVASMSNNTTDEKQKSTKKGKAVLPLEKPKSHVASQEKSKPELQKNSPVKVLSQEELKIIEVVDVIKQLQSSESSVSDREIDSLLKQAQREILKQKIFDETTKTVNAEALLQDVEVELEQSFRDKVFEALKSSYNSVKTAVAERRN